MIRVIETSSNLATRTVVNAYDRAYPDLEAGVFVTRDPAGFVDGPNVYTYIGQNPWTMFDPLGLSPAWADPRSLPNCDPGMRVALDQKDREMASATSDKITVGVLQVIGGFVPYLGDAMDGYDVVSPNSTGVERGVAGVSLTLNVATAGLAPNAGPILRGLGTIGDGISDALKGGEVVNDVAKVAGHAEDLAKAGAKQADEAAGTSAKATQEASEETVAAAATSATSNYGNLPAPRNVGAGKDFTASTKKKILEQNKAQNGGVIKSDKSGAEAIPSQQSKKGVTPSSNEAQIDHIVPKSKGGTNSPDNAQVLTREENRAKSDKYEE